MWTMLFIASFLFFVHANGFLLDNSGSTRGQSIISNQYVTTSEFINETVARHQENEQLRQFVNKALAVLTSQQQHNFDSLEQKLIKCENQSSSSQDSLEQKSNDLEHKYMELERIYTQLQQVSNEFNMMKSQLVSLENKTNQINNDILILKQPGNIKPLHEIQALQPAIQTVSAQTHSLSINERALRQDFLALHNMTIDLKLALNEITTNTSNHLNEFETKTISLLFNLEHRQNTTAADIKNQLKEVETKTNTQLLRIEQSKNSTVADIITRIDAKETSDNLTLMMVQKQINNNAERVAMTAHPLSSGSVTRTIMKFSDVQYSVGITNLAAYRNTGNFTCEQEGLYIISASVMSLSSGAQFYIYMNGNIISDTYIAQNNNNNEKHTGAVTITRELNQNDKVWLYATGSFYLYGGLQSTLTIIKIK